MPRGTLEEPRRPLLGAHLWVPLALVLLGCGAVVYYGLEVARTIEDAAVAAARSQGRASAREITGLLEREKERLAGFVAEKRAEIAVLARQPDDVAVIESVQASLQRLFRGALAFTVTDAAGMPLFEDFDGLVGPVCAASMRDFARGLAGGRGPIDLPPIHPVPDAYHFDLITPWQLDDGASGLFFVSVAPDRIAQILAAGEQASGMRLVLVRDDDPTLIEVGAGGSRDKLGLRTRLQPADEEPAAFATLLPGTAWRLLVLPDAAALEEAVGAVYWRVAASVLALLLISVALLVMIRRHEEHNSGLFMRSLQSTLGRQRAILQSMVDGMVTIDARGRILHVNNAVTRLFGYQPGELIGREVNLLMAGRDRSAHDGYLRHYMETGESRILGRGREVMARRKDGSEFPVWLSLGESIETEGRIFVGILHDLSASREAQRKIDAQADAIRRSRHEFDEISQMARNDLQAPLQRIASLGESLGAAHDGALTGAERDQLRHLRSEARDLGAFVSGLAEYTGKGETPSGRRPVDLAQIVSALVADHAAAIAAAGAEVRQRELPVVLGDPKSLKQLFWNLLDNALKFRDPDRPLHIEVRAAAVADAADRVEIQLADNGIGMPGDQLEAVFDAFHRLHPRDRYPGIGLGLSFCRKIVEGLGGSIRASSEPGVGSTLHVVLPRPVDHDAAAPTASTGEPDRGH